MMKKYALLIFLLPLFGAHAKEIPVDVEHYGALLSAIKKSSNIHADSIIKSKSAPNIELFTTYSYNVVLYVSTQLVEPPSYKIQDVDICELERNLGLIKAKYKVYVQSYDESEQFVVEHAFQNADTAIDGLGLPCSEVLRKQDGWRTKLEERKNKLMSD